MAKQTFRFILAALCTAFFLNGCAGVGMTLFGVGAGVTTGTSVAYTLDGIAYRTFTVPLPQVETAARTALDRMGIRVDSRNSRPEALVAARPRWVLDGSSSSGVRIDANPRVVSQFHAKEARLLGEAGLLNGESGHYQPAVPFATTASRA